MNTVANPSPTQGPVPDHRLSIVVPMYNEVENVEPFVTAGYGTFANFSDSQSMFNYGGGATYWFNKRIGAGLFGGEGFIMQRLQGDGWAFLNAGGEPRVASSGRARHATAGAGAGPARTRRSNRGQDLAPMLAASATSGGRGWTNGKPR